MTARARLCLVEGRITIAIRPSQGQQCVVGRQAATPAGPSVDARCGYSARLLVGELELGELLGEAGVGAAGADLLQRREVGVELLAVAAVEAVAGEPELGGDLVLVEQADVVDRARAAVRRARSRSAGSA